MKDVLNSIKNEHRSLEAILRAMLYYLDAFSARLHHPKEDEFLFQPLCTRSGDAAAIIEELEREHARVAAAIPSLEQALLRYEAGGEREFVAFATAVEGFCDFYLRHMHLEESRVIPLAEKLFSDQERARMDAACAAAREPHGGTDEEREFRQLFCRIAGPAPAPTAAG